MRHHPKSGDGVFEATHGTAPGYAGKDRVNPGSLILSSEMMLRYSGWNEAADKIVNSMRRTIEAMQLTFDLALLRTAAKRTKRDSARRRTVEEKLQSIMPGATLVGTTGFGDAVVAHMDEAD